MLEQLDKKEAIQTATKWLTHDAVILDTVTTGQVWGSEIVELSIIEAVSGDILLNSLVKPSKTIQQDTIDIHHITNEMVADAPSYIELLPQIINVIKGRDIVSYDAALDLRMLKSSLIHYHDDEMVLNRQLAKSFASIQCAMLLYAQYAGDWNHGLGDYIWHPLVNAAQQLNITLDGTPHRALYDCQLTRELIQRMAKTPCKS